MEKDNVINIKPVVTHRLCPKRGYVVSQFEIDAMRVDMECTRCGQHNFSEFQPLNWSSGKTDD